MTIRLFKRTITVRLVKRGRTTTLMASVYKRATPHVKDLRWTAAPDGLWLRKKGNPIRIPTNPEWSPRFGRYIQRVQSLPANKAMKAGAR